MYDIVLHSPCPPLPLLLSIITIVDNYIGSKVVPPSSNEYLDVINPATSGIVGKVALSTAADVDAAVDADAAAPI